MTNIPGIHAGSATDGRNECRHSDKVADPPAKALSGGPSLWQQGAKPQTSLGRGQAALWRYVPLRDTGL
jgi:hypothetical protein